MSGFARPLPGGSIADGTNIVLGTATGTKIGTATGQKLGLFGATPVVQQTGIVQTYATADGTHAARTALALTDNTAGTPGLTLPALTSGTVYATDAPAVRNNLASLGASCNAIIVDLADTAAVLNYLIDRLQALGLLA